MTTKTWLIIFATCLCVPGWFLLWSVSWKVAAGVFLVLWAAAVTGHTKTMKDGE